jgi:hypothetical protein
MTSLHRLLRGSLLVGSLAALAAASWIGVGCDAAHGGYDGPEKMMVDGPGSGAKGAYRVVDPSATSPSSAEDKLGADGKPSKRLIYLSRVGGTYAPGVDDSSHDVASSIDRGVKVPAYSKDATRWSALVTCVSGAYSNWNVDVVDVDPGTATHVEVVVGGVPKIAGLDASVGGMAPIASDGSVLERAVVFVFEGALKTADEECKIATQEIGHALGLDHEYLCGDPMSDVAGCGKARFQDVAAPCGDALPRTCLTGEPQQNTVEKLTKKLGPKPGPSPTPPITFDSGVDSGADGGAPPPPPDDGGVAPSPDAGVDDGGAPPAPDDDGGAPPPPDDGGAPPPPDDDGGVAPTPPPAPPTGGPSITLVSPDDGATLPAGTTIDLSANVTDTASLTSVVLRWTISGKTTDVDCASPPMEVTCDSSGGKYTWHVPVGSGPRTWSVAATDASGATNESAMRSLTLGTAPSPGPGPGPGPTPPPPPPPTGAITIDQPTEGASTHAGDTLHVQITVGIKGIGAVWLRWSSPSGDSVDAVKHVSGSTWAIDIDISPSAPDGPRTIHVYGLDASGTKTDAPDRHITLGP